MINNKGILQIADFGLARHFDEMPPQPGNGNGEALREYTGLVVTRWYRPPELLLQLRRYTPAIDMWGVGYVRRGKRLEHGTAQLTLKLLVVYLARCSCESPYWPAPAS